MPHPGLVQISGSAMPIVGVLTKMINTFIENYESRAYSAD